MFFRELDRQVLVADSPMRPQDLAEAAARGVTLAINNRPDGESPDQPAGAEIEAAARAAGLTYHAIPLGREGVNPDLVNATKAVLEGSDGKVFCFCRSGTRSTTLWALSQAGEAPADQIIAQAAEAGYDMSHLAGYLGQN